MAARGAAKKAPRKKAGGYKMPPPMPAGEVLSDVQAKKKWRIGPSIGVGGFGEIYSACDDNAAPKSTSSYPYVVKIEPHENGPLFVEKHFYSRNANKDDKIGKEWNEEHCIKLIELYKKYANLWDPTDSDYKTVSKRADAWNEIAKKMHTDVQELKRKMATLTSTYRRTHQKVKTRPDEEYVPTWFAYKHLDFLSVKYMDKYTTEEQEQEEEVKEEAEKEERTNEQEKDEDSQDSSDVSSQSSEQSDDSGSQGSIKDQNLEEMPPAISASRKRSSAIEEEPTDDTKRRHKDEFDAFGEYIAHVLRNLDTYSMCCAQKVIAEVIFHARTGRFTVNQPLPSMMDSIPRYDDVNFDSQLDSSSQHNEEHLNLNSINPNSEGHGN